MKSKVVQGLVALVAMLALGSCAIKYRGPTGYVGYETEGKAIQSSNQSALKFGESAPSNTFDDEFVYDSKGNLLNHKQTVYFNSSEDQKNFIIWETQYKLLGTALVPSKLLVNDEAYLELEYEILPVQNKGLVLQPTKNRRFTSQEYNLILGTLVYNWDISLGNYPVAFASDERFVIETGIGHNAENILSLGFDNVVLKKYDFSDAKFALGVNKSYPNGLGLLNSYGRLANSLLGSKISFEYEWKVIAGQICQIKTIYQRTYKNTTDIEFVASAVFNDAGKRISEEWTAVDKVSSDKTPVTVFKQTLSY